MKQRLLLINAGLLVLTLMTAILAVRSWLSPRDMPDNGGENDRPKASRPDSSVITGWSRDFKQYRAVSAHDLFRPEREPYVAPTRPPEAQVTPTPTPKGTPLPPPKSKFFGTLYLGRMRVAMLSDPAVEKGKLMAYKLGDKLLDYTVKRISSDTITLAKEGGTTPDLIELELRDFKVAPEVAAASAVDDKTSRGRHQGPPGGIPPEAIPPEAEIEQKEQQEPINPFKALQEALNRAKKEREEQGFDTQIEDPPALPDFLKNLGAGGEE